MIRKIARTVIPLPARRRLGRARDRLSRFWSRLTIWPPVGLVSWGDLRRLEPIHPPLSVHAPSPVEQHYLHEFFARHVADLRGQILVVRDSMELNIPDLQHAQVAEAATAERWPSNHFSCIILAHTLAYVWDLRGVLRDCHRALKPGGVLLATVPGIRPMSQSSAGAAGDYWRFTTRSMRQLVSEIFPPQNISISSRGNVKATLASFHGLPATALTPEELAHTDPLIQLVVTVRAVKP